LKIQNPTSTTRATPRAMLNKIIIINIYYFSSSILILHVFKESVKQNVKICFFLILFLCVLKKNQN